MISRCTAQETMSKNTLLAIVRAQSVIGVKVGQTVTYIDDNGRNYQVRVVSVLTETVKIELNGELVEVDKGRIQTKTPTFFDKLQNAEWTITSFDPRTQIVCIQINNGKVIENISVSIPSPVSR